MRTKEQMDKLNAFMNSIGDPNASPSPVTYRVRDCPACSLQFSTVKYGWSSKLQVIKRSDGKLQFSNEHVPAWIKCPHCKHAIDFEKLSSTEDFDDRLIEGDQALTAAPLHLHFEPSDFIQLAESPHLNEVDKLDMYLSAWHRINDLRHEEQNWDLSPEQTEFLELILKKLTAVKPNDCLPKAEILRELSRFKEAAAELQQDYGDEKSESHAEQIMLAIERADSRPFNFHSNERDEDFEFMMDWHARRYRSETPQDPNEDLDPPVFYIGNRNWWVKVLGMLSHNWALIEENADHTATVYFFQDTTPSDRPGIVDSLNFSSLKEAEQGLYRNDFSPLKTTPGPWMGEEPRGQIYDQRAAGNFIYSKLGYWGK
jgi:hypothetical protein